MEFIDNFKNRNDNYTSKIKECNYFEGMNLLKEKKGFSDICEVFFNNFDHEYQILDSIEDKENYTHSKKLELASMQDYDKKKYISKFSRNLISKGLQDKNNFSSILFMNIIFNCNCIIYNKSTNLYYETGFNKNYIICEYTKNGWFTNEYDSNFDYNFKDLFDLKEIVNFDIDTKIVFKTDLLPLSKYKMNDLKNIASELNIPLKENGKSILKKDLYEKINLKKIIEGL